MSLLKCSGGMRRLLALIFVSRALDVDATEDLSQLFGSGLVLIQVSAEPPSAVNNATTRARATSPRSKAVAKAILPKPLSRRHREHHEVRVLNGPASWAELLRSTVATKEGVDGGTIAMGGVIVVVICVLGIFIAHEASPAKHEYALEPGLKRPLIGRKNSQQTPLKETADVTVNSVPSESAANSPPPSRKGVFMHDLPLSRPGSVGNVQPEPSPPLPLAAYGIGTRPQATDTPLPLQLAGYSNGRRPNSAETPPPLPPAGYSNGRRPSAAELSARASSPYEVERLQLPTGITPIGSGKFAYPGPQIVSGGPVVGKSPILSYESSLSDDSANAIGKPPPVCKELVLPHCEAWFAVPFEVLESTHVGDINLYGISGKPLLRAIVESESGVRKLTISMTAPKSPSIGSFWVTNGANGKPIMQIKERNDKLYGELQKVGPMRFVLMKLDGTGNMDASPTELMNLTYDTVSNQFTIASSINGCPLAYASRCATSDLNDLFTNMPHLEVRVSPGVDAVLALLCVMGVIIFNPHEDNPSQLR